jgi:hypothetical protein
LFTKIINAMKYRVEAFIENEMEELQNKIEKNLETVRADLDIALIEKVDSMDDIFSFFTIRTKCKQMEAELEAILEAFAY